MAVFFKPEVGWVADIIPFYWEGEYHLFYLKDYRDVPKYGEGTPWFHLGTRDFVNFTDYGEAIVRGGMDDEDLYIFTGCVIEKDGVFHIFYTGHNPHLRQQGKPQQVIMHATSSDLMTWTKNPANPILIADPQDYDIHNWRDPFIFWNEAEQTYWMLLAARVKDGSRSRRGVTALAASPDLIHWEISDPFWEPHLYYTHECPDLFRWGDWWYLVYSTFSDRYLTHYRMSKDLSGVWTAPINDSFDGRAFYAAKTASDGQRRFAFGWNPTRTDDSDTGQWNWGGHLVVHEIVQAADGALDSKLPDEVKRRFNTPAPITFKSQIGEWTTDADGIQSNAPGEFAWCCLGSVSSPYLIETTIRFTDQTRGCGLVFKADKLLDRYYKIQLEPGRNQIVFERWPRPGDEPPILERTVELKPESPILLQVIVDGTAVVVYINNQVAMSARAYESTEEFVGLFVTEGGAVFQETSIKRWSEQ